MTGNKNINSYSYNCKSFDIQFGREILTTKDLKNKDVKSSYFTIWFTNNSVGFFSYMN